MDRDFTQPAQDVGQRQQGNLSPNQDSNPRTEFELFDKIIREGGDTDNIETDSSVPTSNLDKEEMDVIRSLQDLISEFRYLVHRLGLDDSEKDGMRKSSLARELAGRMHFITQSSKAKSGFGALLVRTDFVYQTVEDYQKHSLEDEEKGLLESMQDYLGDSLGDRKVLGDPAEEGYLSSGGPRQQAWR